MPGHGIIDNERHISRIFFSNFISYASPMPQQFHLKNLKTLPYGGASCVIDNAQQAVVYNAITNSINNKCLEDTKIQDQFLDTYFQWIKSSHLNQFKNLDKFTVKAYSNGTTEGFDKFYLRNNKRRFRCFRGEYMYHGASWKSCFPDWKYIDDEAIDSNDAVVISLPFSDTGNQHVRMIDVLETCDQLGVPVLVDCAFVGICHNIDFDFDHPCVTDITFSLSKTFPVANLRIGMRLTREDHDDGLLVHTKTNYNNRLGAAVGIQLLSTYSVDWNMEKWHHQLLNFCKQLDITPSNTVIFGLGDEKYQEYNRGGPTNRLCLAKYLSQGILPND